MQIICTFASLCLLTREHEGPGSRLTRCVRTDATSSLDTARVAAEPGPERVRTLNDHRAGARRRCRPKTAEGIPPFVARRFPPPVLGASPLSPIASALRTPDVRMTARRTRPHRERAGRAEAGHREECSSQDADRFSRARPETGSGGAVVVRAECAFEVRREWQRVCGW
jgi:hypothetical protein